MGIITTIFSFLFIIIGLPIYLLYLFVSHISGSSEKEKIQKAPPPAKSSSASSHSVPNRPRFSLNGKYDDPIRIPNHITLSELNVYNNDPPEKWEFKNRDQRIRYLRGKNISPYMIYPSKRIGRFHSSKDDSKVYLTTLYQCSCPDCRNRGNTCKHIYSLAMHLNLLSGNVNFYYDVPDNIAFQIDTLREEKWMCKKFADFLRDLKTQKLETICVDGTAWCICHIPSSLFKLDQMNLLFKSGLISQADSTDYDFINYVDATYTKDKIVDAVMRFFPTEKRYQVERMRKRDIIEFFCSNSIKLQKHLLKSYYHVRINMVCITSYDGVTDYIYDKIVYPLADYIEY